MVRQAGPIYHLNSAQVPYSVQGDAHRAVRQFVVAAYMMVNGVSAAIELTCVGCYAGRGGGLGNLSLWPDYQAPVGHPLEEPSKDNRTGVWSRRYSTGLALVNPTNHSRAHV